MAEAPSRLNKAALFRSLGYEPHEGQAKVHASTAPRRVLACGVRWGKTLCAAMEAVAAAMEPGKRSIGWVVAPTYDLADKVFREIVMVVRRAPAPPDRVAARAREGPRAAQHGRRASPRSGASRPTTPSRCSARASTC